MGRREEQQEGGAAVIWRRSRGASGGGGSDISNIYRCVAVAVSDARSVSAPRAQPRPRSRAERCRT